VVICELNSTNIDVILWGYWGDCFLHVCQRRAIEIVDEGFRDYAIVKQDFLGDEDKLKRVLHLIPDENILYVEFCVTACRC